MAPNEAVDAVLELLGQLEDVLADLRRHLQDMKEQNGDDDAART
jgi:hypothetical protein